MTPSTAVRIKLQIEKWTFSSTVCFLLMKFKSKEAFMWKKLLSMTKKTNLYLVGKDTLFIRWHIKLLVNDIHRKLLVERYYNFSNISICRNLLFFSRGKKNNLFGVHHFLIVIRSLFFSFVHSFQLKGQCLKDWF